MTDDPVSGKQIVGPRRSTITRNLIIANYKSTWPIDHDDVRQAKSRFSVIVRTKLTQHSLRVGTGV